MVAKMTVTARVRHKDGKSNCCPVASLVDIYAGDLLVAIGELGGKFTAEQALREFRKNPNRFRRAPGAAGIGLDLVAIAQVAFGGNSF